jgi:hypothetical protein
MKNYAALSTVIAAATPTGVAMSAYTPTNSAASCPAVDASWGAASALPPTPNSGLCDCMYASLTCVPSSSLSSKDYGDLFGTLCGLAGSPCSIIAADAKAGTYGQYSMCTDQQKLGIALNAYYVSQKSAASACSFGGKAVTTKASAASTCSAVIASASVAATQSSTSGSSAATSSNFAAPMPMTAVRLGFTDVMVGLYALIAMGVGAGMVLL